MLSNQARGNYTDNYKFYEYLRTKKSLLMNIYREKKISLQKNQNVDKVYLFSDINSFNDDFNKLTAKK